MREFFTKLLVKLHLKRPATFIVRQNGNLAGTFTAASELHALEAFAHSIGHKSFNEVCRVLGISRDAHKLEVVK